MHRAWLCKTCSCFTPSVCNGIEKAKQINWKPTTEHCRHKVQGRKGENKPCDIKSLPEEMPHSLRGARSEKSSRSTATATADTNGGLPDPRLSNPAMSPLMSWGWSSKTCRSTTVVLVTANRGCAPTHGAQATPTDGVCQPPKKLWAPRQQPHALPPPVGCFPNPALKMRPLSPD